MNKLAKHIAITTTVLYVLGVFFTAWYLIALPKKLIDASKYIGYEVLPEIKPLHNLIMIIAFATLIMGLLALIFQMLASKKQEANVVYVEKMKDGKQTAKLNEEDAESFDVSAMSDELLAAIRQAAAGTDPADKKLEKALRVTCNQLQASQGAVYISVDQKEARTLELRAGYALMKPDSQMIRYEYGEGLPGQVAKEGQSVNLNKVPDGYIKVLSGLGSSSPKHLLLVPIRVHDKVAGVVEIASFTPLLKQHEELVKQSFEIMAKIIEESSQQVISHQESDLADTDEENLINHPIKR